MGLSNSKDPLKNIYPQKIKGKNICISQGWMGLFFLEQKEALLQISPVPHRSDFFNFLFQIVKWGNFAETLMYNTLYFTFASPEIQKNRVWPHCAVVPTDIPWGGQRWHKGLCGHKSQVHLGPWGLQPVAIEGCRGPQVWDLLRHWLQHPGHTAVPLDVPRGEERWLKGQCGRVSQEWEHLSCQSKLHTLCVKWTKPEEMCAFGPEKKARPLPNWARGRELGLQFTSRHCSPDWNGWNKNGWNSEFSRTTGSGAPTIATPCVI